MGSPKNQFSLVMEIEDDLESLLQLENDQLLDGEMQESKAIDSELICSKLSRGVRYHTVELERWILIHREKPPEKLPGEPIQEIASLEELFDEEVKDILGEINETEDHIEGKPIEKREEYLFVTPPEGESVVCKLTDVLFFWNYEIRGQWYLSNVRVIGNHLSV